MISKSKVVSDALAKFLRSWGVKSHFEDLEEIIGSVYDAGKRDGEMQTVDLDAQRWRTAVHHLGSIKARFERYAPIYRPRARPYDMTLSPVETYEQAVVWRFAFLWTDLTGQADTLPAIVDLMLEREQAEERP